MSLKFIKTKITATKKTGKVTRAMEAVSAVKMRKSQERAFAARAYARAAVRMLAHIARSNESAITPYTVSADGAERTLLVLVTSDKGLAGAVNSAVLKHADSFLKTHSCDMVCIGRKAVEYAERNDVSVIHKETNVADDVSVDDVAHITRSVLSAFETKTYSAVHILYQNFVSTFEQRATVRQILPLHMGELDTMVREIVPRRGAFSDRKESPESVSSNLQYLIEPSAEAVMPVLVAQLVQIAVYHALLESKACEHSARMVAMKNATDKSRDLVKALTSTFNKARQAAITAEVSEITAGVEAMK